MSSSRPTTITTCAWSPLAFFIVFKSTDPFPDGGSRFNTFTIDKKSLWKTEGSIHTSIMFDNSQTTSYEYDNLSRIRKLTLPNHAYTTYQYNNVSHLTFLGNYKSNGDTISSFKYSLDNVGNRTSIKENNGSLSNFKYDNLYQLTEEVKFDKNENMIYGISYTYDKVSNRLTETDLVSGKIKTYTYENDNRMLSAGNTAFTYDLAGNMTSKTDDNGTTNYEWDYENRLTKITAPNSNITNYDYYGIGEIK